MDDVLHQHVSPSGSVGGSVNEPKDAPAYSPPGNVLNLKQGVVPVRDTPVPHEVPLPHGPLNGEPSESGSVGGDAA